jgi:hypothetical protein
MGDKFEQLRLATAIAHLIPGAELMLTSQEGTDYRAGNHPSAEFTLCEIRRLIASSACPSRPDFTRWIKDFSICGAINDSGVGIYKSVEGNPMARWFSTTLRPETVYEALEQADIDGICSLPVDATITPDSLLGVTTVQISLDVTVSDEVLNELVLIGYGACLVQEVSHSLDNSTACGSPNSTKSKRSSQNF